VAVTFDGEVDQLVKIIRIVRNHVGQFSVLCVVPELFQ
jgi:hypothetical protein